MQKSTLRLGRRFDLGGGKRMQEICRDPANPPDHRALKEFISWHRHVLCQFEDECIDFACKKNLWNFSCRECRHFKEGNPCLTYERLSEDAMACAAIFEHCFSCGKPRSKTWSRQELGYLQQLFGF